MILSPNALSSALSHARERYALGGQRDAINHGRSGCYRRQHSDVTPGRAPGYAQSKEDRAARLDYDVSRCEGVVGRSGESRDGTEEISQIGGLTSFHLSINISISNEATLTALTAGSQIQSKEVTQ